MNGMKLPDNCIVLAAGNEADTGTMVFELDNATRTRFITMRIVADFESWQREYAPKANMSPTTIAFLKQNVGYFCQTEEALEKGDDLYGNPRSWDHVSIAERSIMPDKASRNDENCRATLETMIAGKVGIGLATEYMAVFDIITKMSTLFDILQVVKKGEDEKLSQMWPKEISQLYALSYSMMAYPRDLETGKEIYNLMKKFPEKSTLPFAEMKPPIMEVVYKRLTGMGIKQNDLKVFYDDNREMTDDVISGPLIKISL